MTFDEYQEKAIATAVPKASNLTYMVVGLANESGEVAGKLKKILRGDRSIDEAREDIKAELGDVLWYVSGAAAKIGVPLSIIAEENIAKLQDRKERGVIQGDGDKR